MIICCVTVGVGCSRLAFSENASFCWMMRGSAYFPCLSESNGASLVDDNCVNYAYLLPWSL